MTYDVTLERFKAAPIQLVPIGDVQTNKVFQPREARLVSVRDKGRVEQSSAQHTTTLRLILESSGQSQLEPILLAHIEKPSPVLVPGLHVVDGHHRLRAYLLAGRENLPAHVMPLDFRTAVVLSKLVNCTGRALTMHPEQCRDAAWQYLAEVTQRGVADLPQGESLRSVSARFGISKNTVSSMLGYLGKGITVDEFNPMSIDPGTGWPRWRYVREANNPWLTNLPTSGQEQLERDAERVARQIIKIVEASSPAARARALQMLASEEIPVLNQIESVSFLSHFSVSPRVAYEAAPVPIDPPAVPAQLAHLDT